MREKLEFGKKPTSPASTLDNALNLFRGFYTQIAEREFNGLKTDYPEYKQPIDEIVRISSRYKWEDYDPSMTKKVSISMLNFGRTGIVGAILLERLYPQALPDVLTRKEKKRIAVEKEKIESEFKKLFPTETFFSIGEENILDKIMSGQFKIIPPVSEQMSFGLKRTQFHP
jgi:hypothetical protein